MSIPVPAECPFCRSPDTWFWQPGPGMIAVACANKGCNATGPVADHRMEAVRLWDMAPRRWADA